MLQAAGLIVVCLLVFGGLFLTGAGDVAHAAPLELGFIAGSGLAVLVVGNAPEVSRDALAGFWRVLRGPRWARDDYQSLLLLLQDLLNRARRGGFVAIESDFEAPQQSPAFQAATTVLADGPTTALICDGLRLMSLDLSRPDRADAAMERALAAEFDRRMRAVRALEALADALPALGIVAAVIGIIRAMTVIDQPPEILGMAIASALLGTFLGVFLAYAIVGPVASRLGQILEEEAAFPETARHVLAAFAAGLPPAAAIEVGRTSIPQPLQPTADALIRAAEARRFRARNASAA